MSEIQTTVSIERSYQGKDGKKIRLKSHSETRPDKDEELYRRVLEVLQDKEADG